MIMNTSNASGVSNASVSNNNNSNNRDGATRMTLGSVNYQELISLFSSGSLVFKIIATNIINNKSREMGMVTTNHDYEKRLLQHRYNPLLFQLPFEKRLAYLYGCLNNSFQKPKNEKYDFYWRVVGRHEWNNWFTIYPYVDEMY